MPQKPIVLASSSQYRKTLLARLGLPFHCASPNIDERAYPGEHPRPLVTRLAEEKARALSAQFPDHWIIGSDQVAATPNQIILTKPGDHDAGAAQLRLCSGNTVTFYTGLALFDSGMGKLQSTCELFQVQFRTLSDAEIEHYLRIEQPYDCAGSFKMEGLGITLFESLEGRDPNSLIGLPLIALNAMFRAWGLDTLTVAYRNSRRDSTN
ncbi:Maf family protein [Marinobacter caseinilyticus]|uniref:Maf family protein n=1 Tax=Marinobacter caseinilyticus TaxID=2692195 RepID=UPI00140B4799|nr:nucleoside triphosphate pyrophosphatase [Marinobacter caseinilyticus]